MLFTRYISLDEIKKIPKKSVAPQTLAKCHKFHDKNPKFLLKLNTKCHSHNLVGHMQKRWGDATGQLGCQFACSKEQSADSDLHALRQCGNSS